MIYHESYVVSFYCIFLYCTAAAAVVCIFLCRKFQSVINGIDTILEQKHQLTHSFLHENFTQKKELFAYFQYHHHHCRDVHVVDINIRNFFICKSLMPCCCCNNLYLILSPMSIFLRLNSHVCP
jgi:hypothetical protein